MSSAVEYLYAASLTVAEDAARKKGWHPSGRAAWLEADGTIVLFMCLEEQVAALPTGTRVHEAISGELRKK